MLGCGNMGTAVVKGLLEAHWVDAKSVTVTNPHEGLLAHLGERFGVNAITDNRQAVEGADLIILGLKPQVLRDALTGLRGAFQPDTLVISMAAGVSTRFIESYTGDVPVVRAMPNLGVTVAMGATAITAGLHARQEHLDIARDVFEAVGIVEVVPENLMDAVTGLSGTGPLYVFSMIEALSDAGVKVGLPRDISTRLAVQTVRGTAEMAQQSGDHPAGLRDRVTSPGGTAITALHVLRKDGFQAILMDAVEAAAKRSAQLGE